MALCHIADLEHQIVGVPPHLQVSVASVGGARQQRDSPPAKPRTVCGLQPLQHGGGHEHARPGERMRSCIYSASLKSFEDLMYEKSTGLFH